MKEIYQSTKVIDGFSTVFRQWRATGTHCKFLHGYSLSFKIVFEGELDKRYWVWDFGGMKRAKMKIDGKNPKEWFDFMFDHTTIIADDDPHLPVFLEMENKGLIQLRTLPAVGAEKFAEYVFKKVGKFISEETEGRVRVVSVEAREHEKNSAIFQIT